MCLLLVPNETTAFLSKELIHTIKDAEGLIEDVSKFIGRSGIAMEVI